MDEQKSVPDSTGTGLNKYTEMRDTSEASENNSKKQKLNSLLNYGKNTFQK
jgi:hypothetical protein